MEAYRQSHGFVTWGKPSHNCRRNGHNRPADEPQPTLALILVHIAKLLHDTEEPLRVT